MKPQRMIGRGVFLHVCLGFVLAVAGTSFPMVGQADDNISDDLSLQTVTVVAKGISNMSAASAGDVDQIQLEGQPLLRPAAILENVPGLIVTQHSGEGKANQYFLRAFNLDHGTDLALEVDDLPVNMPSHAMRRAARSDFSPCTVSAMRNTKLA